MSNLHAVARQHLLIAARLQGAGIARRSTHFAALLKWGRPTRVHEQNGSVVLTFKSGYIVGQITTGKITIHPNA